MLPRRAQSYTYYERTEPISNVLRDGELVEALRPTLLPLQAYLAEATEILTAGWPTCGRDVNAQQLFCPSW